MPPADNNKPGNRHTSPGRLKAALQNPANFTIFGVVQDNPLGAFNIYLNEMACDCANKTLDASTTPSGKDWRNRLGAADINTLTHCWTMGEAMRIDADF